MSFENVCFITGTACARKSAMVHLMAEKHGGIDCGENDHGQLLPELCKEEFHVLTRSRDLEDGHDFILQTQEDILDSAGEIHYNFLMTIPHSQHRVLSRYHE